MITINVMPPDRRKKKSKLLSGGMFNIPNEEIIGVGGALIVLLISVHLFTGVVYFFNARGVKKMAEKWTAMEPEANNIRTVEGQLKGMRNRMNSIKGLAASEEMLWSEKFQEISDSVPKGVWLRQISLSQEALVIEGSAVSKMKNEMISVGNFVTNLKQIENFNKYFDSIEVGLIQRRKNSNLAIADYTITATLKNE